MIQRFYRAGIYTTGLAVVSMALALATIVYNGATAHYHTQHWNLVEITAQQLKDGSGHLMFVDARSRSDFDAIHIPNAISLPLEDWDSGLVAFLDVWTPDSTVVVYCGAQSCGLSKEVALRLLKDLPDAKIFVLKGGLPAWQQYHFLNFEHSNA